MEGAQAQSELSALGKEKVRCEVKWLKRIILELAWEADDICHEVIEWADPQSVKTVEQLRGLLEGEEGGAK